MTLVHVILLAAAGLAGGFVAGIIGVGGGIIFAPVLFFYFSAIDLAPGVVTPLTLGSSLLCTCVAAASSAYSQHRTGTVDWTVAGTAGLFSAAAVFLMVRYVTTAGWYDGEVFQVVFGLLLLLVVARMLRQSVRPSAGGSTSDQTSNFQWSTLAGIGTSAGIVAPAAGIGGGIVMVPTYHHLLGMELKRSFATSSATIVCISGAGILNYAIFGWTVDTPTTAVGYVDVGRALLLAVPAVVSARWGVSAAHHLNTKLLRWGFSALAVVVALRLLL